MAFLIHEIAADDKSYVTALSYNSDGSLLASSGFDASVRLWETNEYTETGRCVGHENCANAIVFRGNDESLVTASSDCTVRIWDIATRKNLKTFKPHSRPIVGLAPVPGTRLFATSSYDGSIRFIDIDTGVETGRIKGKGREIGHICFPGDGSLATGGISSDITFWSVPDGKLLGSIRAHNGGIAALRVAGEGRCLISVGFDGEVKSWEREGRTLRWQEKRIYRIYKKGYFFSALSPSQKQLAVSVVRGMLILDVGTGELIDEIKVKPKSLYGPCFHPDGNTIAAGGSDGKIRIWRVP